MGKEKNPNQSFSLTRKKKELLRLVVARLHFPNVSAYLNARIDEDVARWLTEEEQADIPMPVTKEPEDPFAKPALAGKEQKS